MQPYCVLISLLTYHFTVNFIDPFPNMHMTLTELVFARSGTLKSKEVRDQKGIKNLKEGKRGPNTATII